jgi:hypothetical protein
VASERQIAANRRNASKSTGPRSHNGKQRSARNARKHGLAEHVPAQPERDRLIDTLAKEIAGDTQSANKHAYARVIAECEVELECVRRVRVGLMEGARALERNNSGQEENLLAKRSHRGGSTASTTREGDSSLADHRSTEAMRRALPDLVKISRYERRAAARRDMAVRRLIELPPEL